MMLRYIRRSIALLLAGILYSCNSLTAEGIDKKIQSEHKGKNAIPDYIESKSDFSIKTRDPYNYKEPADNKIHRSKYGSENKHLDSYETENDYKIYLFNACKSDNVMIARSILKYNKLLINLIDQKTGMSLLSNALISKSYNVMRYLLREGIKIDAIDINKNTALHIAVMNDDLQAFDLLISSGANISIRNNEGKLPLEYASDIKFYHHLIGLTDNHNLVVHQIIAQDEQIFYELISNLKFDIDYIDKDGNSLVMHALNHKRFKIAKFLIKNGCNIKIVNVKKEKAIDIAKRINAIDIIRIIDTIEIKDRLYN